MFALIAGQAWGLLVALFALVVLIRGGNKKGAPERRGKDDSDATPTGRVPEAARFGVSAGRTSGNGEHTAARPDGTGVRSDDRGTSKLEVAGERYRQEAFRRLAGRARGLSSGIVSHHDASLALDPTNPFDSHAIAVWIKDQHVGYVPRDEAKLYGPLLRGLADEGKHLVVPARVWIRRGGDRIYARVTLDVPSWSQTRTEHWLPVEAATYSPAAPTSEVVDPWMKGGSRVDVVGERYRTDALKALFRRIPADDSGAKSLDETAVLVPDPDNPYRLNSIAVFVKGHHVGDVATVAADQLYKPLVALADGGKHIGVRARARLWQSQYSSVEVSLDPLDPRLIHPVNDLPDEDHILIPAGSRIQVTKEEHHLDVLNEYTDPAGPTPVAVTLHEIYEERPRSVFHAVEVRLREQRVGILSPVQSKNLLPLVLYVAARGKVAVARAVVEGTKLKAEVVLNAVKAQDADHDWLESLGPETQEPARARRPDFDWDDDDLEPV